MLNVEKIYAKCPYNGHLADIWVEGYIKCQNEIEHDKQVNEGIVQKQKPRKRRAFNYGLPHLDNNEPDPNWNVEFPEANHVEAIPFGNGVADQVVNNDNVVNIDENVNMRFVKDHFEFI